MQTHRALTRAAGRTRQLQPGQHLAGTRTLRIVLADGTRTRLALDDNSEIPVTLATGETTVAPEVFHG